MLVGCLTDEDVQPIHSVNQAHGHGKEAADDCFSVPACKHCREELLTGFTMNRHMKQEAWNLAYFRWQRQQWEDGLVRVVN